MLGRDPRASTSGIMSPGSQGFLIRSDSLLESRLPGPNGAAWSHENWLYEAPMTLHNVSPREARLKPRSMPVHWPPERPSATSLDAGHDAVRAQRGSAREGPEARESREPAAQGLRTAAARPGLMARELLGYFMNYSSTSSLLIM